LGNGGDSSRGRSDGVRGLRRLGSKRSGDLAGLCDSGVVRLLHISLDRDLRRPTEKRRRKRTASAAS
jgi:hypothetical protein